MDISTLIDTIKTALANDAAVDNWANLTYGQTHTTYVNIDIRNPPGEDDCPYIVFYPTSKTMGSKSARKQHRFDVICCIHDSESETNPESNIVEYKGVVRIWEFRKLVEDALDGMSIGNALIDLVEVEYDTMDSFPFMIAAVAVDIGEEHLIGANPLS